MFREVRAAWQRAKAAADADEDLQRRIAERQRPWIEFHDAWRAFVYELARSLGIVRLADWLSRMLERRRR